MIGGRAPGLEDVASDLGRLDLLLAHQLRYVRSRGRSPLGDAVGGALIETGEAEAILDELAAEHAAVEIRSAEMTPFRSPLVRRAIETFALPPFDAGVLLLAIAVELDARYGRVIAYLNDRVSCQRPTVGLAGSLLGLVPAQAIARMADHAPLIANRLIAVSTSSGLADAELSLSPSFRRTLLATPPVTEPPCALELSERVAARLADVVTVSTTATVVVSGPPGSGRGALARRVVLDSGRRPLIADRSELSRPGVIAELERDAAWLEAAPILTIEQPAELDFVCDQLDDLTAPAVIVAGPDDFARLAQRARNPIVELAVPALSPTLRARLWTRASGEAGLTVTGDLGHIAARYPIGPRLIHRALEIAATLHGVSCTEGELEAICRRLPVARLGALADKLPLPYERSELVVAAATRRELDLAITWIRHAHHVFATPETRGLHAPPGLACLFSGPPGTGKTMAAQVVAREVGLELYRVDLSRVVSKYIGETEKNMAAIFDEAARAGAVLFFDEADALFAKRTEVKDAHDRHANVETGFLLQRMESHPGVSILATNLKKNLDEAFLRRLQIIAEFPRPDAADRLRIWMLKLPESFAREHRLDLQLLAEQFETSGGEIRNAAITAHLLAAKAGVEIAMSHVVSALWRELQKAGRILDPDRLGKWREVVIGS